MADLIDRQAVVDALNKLDVSDGVGISSIACNVQESAISAIQHLPSAQPDIIHCKDCKHWMPYDWMFSEVWRSVSMDDYSDDEIGCAYCDMNMHANDFCSRAERKNDE